MMTHIREIEDAALRDGVHVFQTQMEILVVSLLDEDPAHALVQIEEARAASLENVRNWNGASLSAASDPKVCRIAIAILERTFDRLRIVVEAPDDDGGPLGGRN